MIADLSLWRSAALIARGFRGGAWPVRTAMGGAIVALWLVTVSAISPLVPGAIAGSMPEDMTSATLTAAMAADARRDYAAERELLLPLAQDGSAIAQYDLGILYAKGEDVPIDYAEAVGWFRKAANQGLAPAQYAMGLAYAHGQGVQKDDAEARHMLSLAARQGYALAQAALKAMASRGESGSPAHATAQKINGQGRSAERTARFNLLALGIIALCGGAIIAMVVIQKR
jgi:Sel1 repeat